jgi:hypothetical protein
VHRVKRFLKIEFITLKLSIDLSGEGSSFSQRLKIFANMVSNYPNFSTKKTIRSSRKDLLICILFLKMSYSRESRAHSATGTVPFMTKSTIESKS